MKTMIIICLLFFVSLSGAYDTEYISREIKLRPFIGWFDDIPSQFMYCYRGLPGHDETMRVAFFECYPSQGYNLTDESDRCIPLEMRCDGIDHCLNGEDEVDCDEDTVCPAGYIPCRRGQCINEARIEEQLTPQYGFDSPNHLLEYCADHRSIIQNVLRKLKQTWATCDTLWCYPRQFCVRSDDICDGRKDCPDGSDEQRCEDHACPRGGLRCAGEVCVEEFNICDGYKQCPGGEDEDETFCQQRDCGERQFKCPSTGQCIYNYSVCNGWSECRESEDEDPDLCSTWTCSEDTLKCMIDDKHQCVPSYYICDKTPHCSGGEDETPAACEMVERSRSHQVETEPCKESNMIGRSLNNFRIWNEETADCRPYTQQCSVWFVNPRNPLITDRIGHSIETCGVMSCKVAEAAFTCQGGDHWPEHCIMSNSVCDGYKDCIGGDDEDEGFCRSGRRCFRGQFDCGDGQCIQDVYVCDGVRHCVSGRDEDEDTCVAERPCPVFMSPCGNGQCVGTFFWCDGKTDCLNGRDENRFYCRELECPEDFYTCRQPVPSPERQYKCLHDKIVCGPGPLENLCADEIPAAVCSSPCREGEVSCGHGVCMQEEYVCTESEINCHNGSYVAPEFCRERRCGEGQFSCGQGQCLPQRLVCDGVTDCFKTERDESVEVCGEPANTVDNKGTDDCEDLLPLCASIILEKPCTIDLVAKVCEKTCGVCDSKR